MKENSSEVDKKYFEKTYFFKVLSNPVVKIGEVEKCLLLGKMDPNTVFDDGTTPMHIACNQYSNKMNRILLIKVLIEKYKAKHHVADNQGWHPFDLLIRNKEIPLDIIKYFVETLKIDLNSGTDSPQPFLPIISAIERSLPVEIIEYMISKNCNCNVYNYSKQSPLILECKKTRNYRLPVIELLLSNGADPNVMIISGFGKGKSPLELLKEEDKEYLVKKLDLNEEKKVKNPPKKKVQEEEVTSDLTNEKIDEIINMKTIYLPSNSIVTSSIDIQEDENKLQKLLNKVSLGEYYESFEKEGVLYEDLEFVINDEEILSTIIPKAFHRKRLINELKKIFGEKKKFKRKGDKELFEFLKSINMSEKFENFVSEEVLYEDLESLLKEEDVLKEIIPKAFPRKKFVRAVKEIGVKKLESEKGKSIKEKSESAAPSMTMLFKKKKRHKENWELSKSSVVIGEPINSGSFGLVKKGTLKIGVGEIDVAIKEIAFKNKTELRDIKKEIKLMSKFKNRFVLKCFGGYFDKKNAYIILELCESDLNKHRKKKSSIHMRILTLFQIAKGMQYLHFVHNVVHRDLKSENILVKKDNTIRICDFGTSKKLKNAKETFCGTAEYISPEQYGIGKITDPKKVDVYSFGILIWEVYSRLHPFAELHNKVGGNHFEMLSKIHTENIRPSLSKVKDMPEELKQLMCSCWNKDPSKRPNFQDISEKIKLIYIKVRRKKE